ncbi:hypothetical protein BGX24_001551, partial [Mortierella sp. AD032]
MDPESFHHHDSAPMRPHPAAHPSSSSAPADPTTMSAAVPLHPHPVPRVKSTKAHVPSACINCKKAHLACDLSRPCKRCVSVGKDDTCRDVEHKKRGRPKLVDRTVALDAVVWGPSGKEGGAPLAPKPHTASSALAKTRVKGKYTKSANYKMPKKVTLSAKMPNGSSDAFPIHHSNSSEMRPSSYPNQDHERASSSLSYRSHQPSAQGYQSRPLSLHSEPPLSSDHQDSFNCSPSYPSSSNQVKRPQEMYSSPSTSPLATVFLTMNLICARVSDESQALWGYHPHDISHKTLYSIITSEDQSKVRSLLATIREAVFSAVAPGSPQRLSDYSFLESSSPVFYQNRPGIMSSSAPGSNEYSDVVRVCHADGGSSMFSIRMYVGGGLGTDLIRGLNLEHAYVVCIMAQHTPPPPSTFNDHTRSSERHSLEDTRATLYSHTQPSRSTDSPYSRQQPLQQRFPPMEPLGSSHTSDKISLPPIMTGPSSTTQSPSLSSPSAPSPLSSSSSNSRPSLSLSSSAPGTPFSGLSLSSYTVPLSKPSSHSSALPSLRTGPLHTARWLFDPEPFGGSSHTGPSASSHRLPTVFAESFRSLSAPMGGFGVSKYLNRSEPTPSFGNVRRHQLPLPSPLQSSQPSSSDASQRTPRSLQKDLSTSSFGASFASRSPPSMKRPLADMADSQDRNRDIDNRHQDHHHHQGSRSSIGSAASSMSLGSSARSPYTPSIKMDLQSMPPDHPAIDPSSAGVCPIVHGSHQRERVQLTQKLVGQPIREVDMREDSQRPIETEKKPFACRWAKMGEQWLECKDNGPSGHDCRSPLPTPGSSYDRNHEREME